MFQINLKTSFIHTTNTVRSPISVVYDWRYWSGVNVFTIIYLSIHPRYKHEVAYRLYLGALAVAYHVGGINFEGPFPTSATIDNTHRHLTVEYDRGLHPIEVRSNQGFEVSFTVVDGINLKIDMFVWNSSFRNVLLSMLIKSVKDFVEIIFYEGKANSNIGEP